MPKRKKNSTGHEIKRPGDPLGRYIISSNVTKKIIKMFLSFLCCFLVQIKYYAKIYTWPNMLVPPIMLVRKVTDKMP